MVTLTEVKASLERVAHAEANRVDARAGRDLAPRYVEHGAPCCLVATVLADLGVSLGVLRALDRESRHRSEGGGGVLLDRTEHPIRNRFDTVAWQLLCEVQRLQDRAMPWPDVVDKLLRPNPKPWEFPPHYPWNSAS